MDARKLAARLDRRRVLACSLMAIPTLPTDNLYKFMALAGLALYGLGFFYPSHYMEQTLREQANVSAVLSKAEVKGGEARRSGEDAKSAALAVDAALRRRESDKVLTRLAQQFSEVQRRHAAVVDELGLLLREADSLRILNETSKARAESLVKVGNLVVPFGAVVSILGFALWYVRVQRFQDALIARQSRTDTTERTPSA